jgi:methylmalonyl-CoA/ethylmalonyl-CoA epimerase
MIKRIDHISIAVSDLEKAKKFFLDGLGGRELFCAPSPSQKFRWTTIELGTSCLLELIDPVGEDGFLHRFIQTHGEGLHHITVQVNDIQEALRTLEERGIPTFGFCEPLPGWKEAFVHPKDAFGVLLQLAQFNPLDWIEPTYIPRAYEEFAPPKETGSEREEVKVRRLELESGPCVELRQGDHVIRVPETHVRDLIRALEEQTEDGA